MRKVHIIHVLLVIILVSGCATPQPKRTVDKSALPFEILQTTIDHFDIDNAQLTDVLEVFGEPQAYIWGKKAFQKDHLPQRFIMRYSKGFQVVMISGRVEELRFEGEEAEYCFRDTICIGTSLQEVIGILGEPTKTVNGGKNTFEDSVLYKDIDGKQGYCYWAIEAEGIRMFFWDNKVSAFYLTSTVSTQPLPSPEITEITSVKPYQDIRWKDLRNVNVHLDAHLIQTLWFHETTIWPESYKQLARSILQKGMNPGLGVKALHAQGITGKGVNVAIIDQNMCLDHPEYRGKIVKYYDVGTHQPHDKGSMHAPAVTSLLVGENIGTAPAAHVYFVATPSWTRDAQYQAEALNWIIDENEHLPEKAKIRVVSVSAAPSGPGSPFTKNTAAWDAAYQRALKAKILVLDCTSNHGITAPCYYDIDAPDDITKCTPGYPDREYHRQSHRIHIPTSFRTQAEEYHQGSFSYQYTGRGGLSWTVPYLTGVLALGWQVRPDLTSIQMLEILFETAYVKDGEVKIINPRAFVDAVKHLNSR